MNVSIHTIATRKSHPHNPVDLICWVIENQAKWAPGEKLEMIRQSFLFWKDKAVVI